ncbi:MAG: DUF6531 domain-containing protein [Terriglobales bacterium]
MCALCVFLQTLLSISLEAQSNINNCKASVICFNNSQWYAVCVPPLPPGVSDCNGFDFTEYCVIPLYDCPPAPCPTCNGATAAQPINLATGDTYIQQSDVTLPGLGGGLNLTRTWNSMPTPDVSNYGMFGHEWSSTFEEQVFIGPDNMIKHLHGDGSLWTYGFAQSWGPTGYTPVFWTAAPRNGGATMTYYGPPYVAAPYWILTLKDGATRSFYGTPGNLSPNQTFYLSSISDRNGNTASLSYDSSHLLTTVTDASGRHLYFSYGGVVVGGAIFSVVTSVTSDFGVSLSYQYDASANLVRVTKPDGTYVSFQYNSAGQLTSVTDSAGKILESHTYDILGRGLTSTRAGGADSITVSY